MAIAHVTYYSIDDIGVIATVNIAGNMRNVPVMLDWNEPNVKVTLCQAIKADCVANDCPVTRVVLPCLYTE